MTSPKDTLMASLVVLRPGAQWVWYGMDYSGLVWLDEVQIKPTAEELGL